MEPLKDDDYCFVCGQDNPFGLKLKFSYEESQGEARAVANFPRHLQGWNDILHGGVLSMVLDEAMAKAIGFNGMKGVTTELKVKFRQKARPATNYMVIGRITAIKKRLALTEAQVLDSDNKPIAVAEATFFLI